MQYPICNKSLFSEYENNVIDLANKLPQWNPKTASYERRYYSAISSLFEEAGELSGLVSKKRIRKDYWKSDTKSLKDFEDIRSEFLSEASDFLWVMVCSYYCLHNISDDIYTRIFNNIHKYEINKKTGIVVENLKGFVFEHSVYELFSVVVLMRSTSIFEDGRELKYYIYDLVKSFSNFAYELYLEYNISLTDMINYNMNKLGTRYDKNGQRTDGK